MVIDTIGNASNNCYLLEDENLMECFALISNVDWGFIITVFALIAPTITAIFGVHKYFYEKNRLWYERRLNEVYAPLYGQLVKQETFRQLFLPKVTIQEAPILSSENRRIDQTVKYKETSIEISKKETTSIGILDRTGFFKVLNDTNKGIARPKLLILIYQYELLVHLEETADKQSNEWKMATEQKIQVEYALFNEIQEGYKETVEKLKLGEARQAFDLKKCIITK